MNLEEITELGRYLAFLDVIDISFETDHTLEVYVAHNDRERAQGLARLPSIDTAGMLFCYDKPTYAVFSMKDMLFDLDVGWYDAHGTRVQSGTYEAGDTQHLVCPQPFSYVLEVPAGTLPIADMRVSG